MNSLVFKLLVDASMIGLGSYGTYILIGEFVELQHIPALRELFAILHRRWFAVLATAIAFALFFIRMYTGLIK